MLFSSFVFIFAFLPATLVAFYLFRMAGQRAALWVLTLASIAFYAWWRPSQTWILLLSIVLAREAWLSRKVSAAASPEPTATAAS